VNDEPIQPVRLGSHWFALIAAGTLVTAIGAGWLVGKFRQDRDATPDPSHQVTAGRGALLFQVHCASCHGSEGHADGPSAGTLRPRPRDFAGRPWRFEVTPSSIRKVILDGIPGTTMPASRTALPPADIEALVEHVQTLAMPQTPTMQMPLPEAILLRDNGFVDLRGTETPPLQLSDVAGGGLKLSDLKGQLVLVNFWGTSCVHCLNEMPQLRELEAALADRHLTVLHVCADLDDIKAAQDVAGKVAPGVRIFVDGTGLGLAHFEVQTLPTVWLIGTDGRAIGRAHGAKDWRAPLLRKLLEHWLPPKG
jgi:mono/diheme cytochrome c family protein